MDAGRYGKIIKEETDMCNLVSNNDFLKTYTDANIDYIDSSMSIYKNYKYNLKLFYKGIERYAKCIGIKSEELFDGEVIRYRIEYNNLIIAIGMEFNKDTKTVEYHITTLPDHDYVSCINFNDIIKYYGGESKQVSKYLHLNKRAV